MVERIGRSSGSTFPGLVIANVLFTDIKLGRGADATVFEVDWNGTRCAAKRLHEILLEDQSAGGVAKLLSNFEAECLTWSKLRHPGVVQFLGVHMDRRSRLPVLVMEKMDTSLRTYLEDHSKEQFPLHQKAFVLRQVTQALAYLHSQNPPLVHHDLSPNNVLLNVASFVTKVSDFGMSRAINPSAFTRKSSIKGTLAFMAPEALQNPPRYNEKLDVFSFGNVILHTVTHEWPDPGPPTKYEGDVFVAVTELQRREQCVKLFTAREKQLFLPIVRQCLENRPDKRPSSVMLVQELRRIESTLPRGGHVSAPIEHLRQQLSAKEEECRQKDEVIRENSNAMSLKDEALKEKDVVISKVQQQLAAKETECRQKDEAIREKNEVIRKESATIRVQQAEIQRLRDQPAVSQQVDHPLRDWRKLGKCQKVIQHRPGGGVYVGVAVNSEGLLAVTDGGSRCVHLLNKEGTLVKSIGKGMLGGTLCGTTYDLEGSVWVTDTDSNKVLKLSQDGRLLHTIDHADSKSDHLNRPTSVSVSPEGLIYICDRGNHSVTVHDEEGMFLFAFGSKGSGPGCFEEPCDVTFGTDGLVYVTDEGCRKVCVWSKEGSFQRDFTTKYDPTCIASTGDNHLLITSWASHTVMVYTLGGQLVHEHGGSGSYMHFKPIVNLPAYKMKRGDEEEDEVYTSRAKLYHFQLNRKEWKERGVGELKMLRNRRSGKVRLLMRRDQVLKICCNHFLSADMTLRPKPNSDRTWTWFTSCDFSEGEARAEKLAASFKNAQLAQKFKEAFEINARLSAAPQSAVEKEPTRDSRLPTPEVDSWGFAAPYGICVDDSGAVYVTDNLNGRVRVF